MAEYPPFRVWIQTTQDVTGEHTTHICEPGYECLFLTPLAQAVRDADNARVRALEGPRDG